MLFLFKIFILFLQKYNWNKIWQLSIIIIQKSCPCSSNFQKPLKKNCKGNCTHLCKETNVEKRKFWILFHCKIYNCILFLFFCQTNQLLSVDSTTLISDGSWHHILVAVLSNSVNFYLDGKRIGSMSVLSFVSHTQI